MPGTDQLTLSEFRATYDAALIELISYLRHDAEQVALYLEESFRVPEPDAAIVLTHG